MHRAVHLVTEEPFLFARTVRENLTIGALAGALDPEVRIPDEDLWADPRGEFLAQVHASPVYALFGEPEIRADQMPPLNQPHVAGRRAYHVRTGTHNLTPYDWGRFADFADRLWRK